MIKVLHVIDHLGSGGAQTALLNLLRFADRTRFDYTVAAMHGRGAVAEEFAAIGIRVVSLSPAKWPPDFIGHLWQLLRRERYDVVHCHLFASNWIAKPLAWLAGCRTLFSHDQCNDAFRSESMVVTTIDAVTNALSTHVLCVSHSIVDFLGDRECLPPERLEYFPNAVDPDAFLSPSTAGKLTARQRWHLPPDALLVGGVGRLVPQKDFATFLRAAARICPDHPRLHFVVFGEGPEEESLKSLATELGLAGRVTFAGYVNERAAIYQAIDLLFLTSLFEGTPMVLLEAMAAGVPIAASRIDGSAEILQDGREAVLFPPGDPAAAAPALRSLLDDEKLRQDLASAARARVSLQFNARSQMRRLEDLYTQTLAVCS